jgi:hypothetical protein
MVHQPNRLISKRRKISKGIGRHQRRSTLTQSEKKRSHRSNLIAFLCLTPADAISHTLGLSENRIKNRRFPDAGFAGKDDHRALSAPRRSTQHA